MNDHTGLFRLSGKLFQIVVETFKCLIFHVGHIRYELFHIYLGEGVVPSNPISHGEFVKCRTQIFVIKGFLAFFAVCFQAFCVLHNQSSSIKI